MLFLINNSSYMTIFFFASVNFFVLYLFHMFT